MMKEGGQANLLGRRKVRLAVAANVGLGLLTLITLRNVWPVYSDTRTPATPGPQLSQASYPIVAASLTPAASPTPSPETSPTSTSSAAPTPPPNVPVGGGHWEVNGATIKAGGALATEIDAGGNVFTGAGSATKGGWSVRFGVSGQSPVTAQGTASGPSPVMIDVTVHVFDVPVTVRGTPGSNLSVSIGTPHASVLTDAVPVAAVQGRTLLAASPEETATRVLTDTTRGAVASAIVGCMLLLIVPGLRRRGRVAARSMPLKRLGIGAILALDIPLGAIVLMLVGVPLGLWWIGLVVLAMFAALAVAGYAFSGYQLGVIVLDRVASGSLMWLAEVALGAVLLVLAGQIPYVGPLVSIVAVLYGIGSMLYAPAAATPAEARAAELEARPEAPVPAGGRPIVE